MSIVTSYYPGRIRLRANILKDMDISGRAIEMLQKQKALKNISYNQKTGSILIEYAPDMVDVEKLKCLLPEVKRIQGRILFYDSKKDKAFILEYLDKLEKEIDRLNIFS